MPSLAEIADQTTIEELRARGSVKWTRGGPGVIGAFVAEMDFGAAPPIQAALLDDETLAGLLAEYETVAAATDELVRTLPDLGATQPLPTAPWFPPNARWSARRALLHVIAETAQHCGHADIIRESIDGQKTMG